MDHKIVFSKTGKGVLEIKNKAGKLSRELAKVLGLVDGKSSVADLIAKSKLAEADVSRVLKQLEDRGFIKEFSNLSNAMSSASSAGSSSYVDDLDFTSQLSPGKRIYSSSQAEMRQRESADREQAETEAKRNREQADQKKKDEATRQAREEATRLARIEAERKTKEAAAVKARQQAELKAKQQEAEMEKTTRDLAKILEAERQALEKSSGQKKEQQARKAKEESERQARDDSERKRREEAEGKQRQEAERKRREEAERKQREEAERKQREEEERKRREEAERKRREEEERKQREEAERKRREEEERKQREEAERKQREEEERKQREEEGRKRREEEDRRREEEDRRREEEDRRREEEARSRRETDDEEARSRRYEEERERDKEEADAPSFDIGSFDLPSGSEPEESSTPSFDSSSSSFASDPDPGSSFDLPSLDSGSSENFTADFDRQQEELKKQEAQEERRRHEAEEARTSMERARREEEAREEAERRAAMEAEMRARVEQEKSERSERERAKEEEYKRKIEQEEERKRADAEKKEREEFEQVEADRKKREEELAHRRQQAEESDRKRAELKSLQKRGRIRSPIERARPFIIGVVVVIAVLIGGAQVVPMSGFIPGVEKMLSRHLGEPVTIGSMKLSVLSGVQFQFGNVNIGTTQDVTLTDVLVTPELGSLFGDKLVLSTIRADGGTIVKEALVRLPGWLSTSVSDPAMEVRSISLSRIKLEMRTFAVPSLNADVAFGRDGTISSATVATADGKLSVELDNIDSPAQVRIRASNWSPPFGAPFNVTDFSGNGVLTGSTIRLNEWEAMVYGGQAKGTADISWGSNWRLSSQFEFARIETEELLAVFSDTAKVSGSASGKGSFLSQSGTVDALLDRPSLDASFVVKKGTVDGVDLVRALQAGQAGTQGGSTRFEELTGAVSVANGRFGYRDVELAAGILSARSTFTISENAAVNGRVYVALSSPSQRLSANMNISGSLKGISLRP